ncbi:MAG: hypothetical protein LC635_03555 [Pseudonocardiaceae bacterium]|nr:hypothetical protein [Pseudonocardiaceae bacterium]
MDQASNNVRETAAFARRVVCRTLTVVGGVAAGTALAWWLSATAASAPHEHPTHQYPADGYGRADLPTVPVTVPAVVTAATGADLDAVADRTAKDRAFADGMSRRGSPAPARPGLPGWPSPFGPSLPTVLAAGNHSQAGNSLDSHLYAALPWQNSIADLVAGGLSTATGVATFTRPGAQPGVAPD